MNPDADLELIVEVDNGLLIDTSRVTVQHRTSDVAGDVSLCFTFTEENSVLVVEAMDGEDVVGKKQIDLVDMWEDLAE